jgi:hypothetical protein
MHCHAKARRRREAGFQLAHEAGCHDWLSVRSSAMPRYFFDVQNGESRRDEVGAEFMDDQAAWKEAVQTMRGAEDALAPGDTWRVTVRRDVRILYRN